MTGTVIIGYLKTFVKKSLAGLGALKGSPAKVKSIEPTYSTLDPAVITKNKVNLQWDSNESRDPTVPPQWTETSFFVVDNGRQIYDITEIPEKRSGTHLYYEVRYYDGSVGHFYLPMSSSQMKRKVVTVLPPASEADLNTIYMIED